ncbi:Rrf2 family transcriptional regulator [bacterium]|nr:MAG: Rrf2 family transcriptional regulator [bacterium]
MVLSKACTYGILATLYVAKENKEFVPIRELSDELHISFHFLTKILQQLTAQGLLISLKGPKGGVKLAKDPATITYYDVIRAIDGDEVFTECVLGLPGCGHEAPCPIHEFWSPTRDLLKTTFVSQSLEESAYQINELKLRLSLGHWNLEEE